jgi:hypothetical protein
MRNMEIAMDQRAVGGNSLVEFALVFPLFLAIGLMVIDLVLFAGQQIFLTAWARESIRQIAVSQLKTEAEMEVAVMKRLEGKKLQPDRVQINFEELLSPNHLPTARRPKNMRVIKMVLSGRYQTRCSLLGWLGAGSGFNWRINERALQVL